MMVAAFLRPSKEEQMVVALFFIVMFYSASDTEGALVDIRRRLHQRPTINSIGRLARFRCHLAHYRFLTFYMQIVPILLMAVALNALREGLMSNSAK